VPAMLSKRSDASFSCTCTSLPCRARKANTLTVGWPVHTIGRCAVVTSSVQRKSVAQASASSVEYDETIATDSPALPCDNRSIWIALDRSGSVEHGSRGPVPRKEYV